MLAKRTVNILLTVSFVFSGGRAYSQEEFLREQKAREKYYAERAKCRDLIKSRRWKKAEIVCTALIPTAKKFGDFDRELVESAAHQLSGHVMMGQRRYRAALDHYQRAHDVVRARLTEEDGELGQLYGDIAAAHHALRELDKARELYRKSEKTYWLAIADIDDERFERQYRAELKKILELHRSAAEQAGALWEVEEIKKELERLP
jgi:hypothetical protein